MESTIVMYEESLADDLISLASEKYYPTNDIFEKKPFYIIWSKLYNHSSSRFYYNSGLEDKCKKSKFLHSLNVKVLKYYCDAGLSNNDIVNKMCKYFNISFNSKVIPICEQLKNEYLNEMFFKIFLDKIAAKNNLEFWNIDFSLITSKLVKISKEEKKLDIIIKKKSKMLTELKVILPYRNKLLSNINQII